MMLRNNPYHPKEANQLDDLTIYRQVYTWLDSTVCHKLNFRGPYASRTIFNGERWQWGYLSDSIHAIYSEMICQRRLHQVQIKADLIIDMRFLMCDQKLKTSHDIKANSNDLIRLFEAIEAWPDKFEPPSLWWMDSSVCLDRDLGLQEMHPDKLTQCLLPCLQPMRSDSFFDSIARDTSLSAA